MSTNLQSSLYELENVFKQGSSSASQVSQKLAKLKVGHASDIAEHRLCWRKLHGKLTGSLNSPNLDYTLPHLLVTQKTSLLRVRHRHAAGQTTTDISGGILEIGAFHSLRQQNLKAYWQYNSQLQPFYNNLSTIIPQSPNRPITLGLHLLALLAEGKLSEFHTLLETLDKELLDDVFVRLPVDMDRWLMEGSYLKIYRAKDRVPREEFQYLLEQLWSTMR